MNCIRCGRALSLAKVTVTTKAGQSSWGPVCARKAKHEEDTAQMTLELTV